MTFPEFVNAVEARGLTAVDYGKGHWQIQGGKYCVNFYPDTGTYYVNGMNSGLPHRHFSEVLAAAFDPPVKQIHRRRPRKKILSWNQITASKNRALLLLVQKSSYSRFSYAGSCHSLVSRWHKWGR